MRQRKDFGTVRIGHGAFTGRIESGKEEDKECNHSQVRLARFGNIEAEPGGEQRPSHLGKCEQQKGPSAKSVDCKDGWPCEDEVDQTEPPWREKGFLLWGTGFYEDGRGIEGNDVDTAHLLRKHNSKGGQRGSADPRDCKQLKEPL